MRIVLMALGILLVANGTFLCLVSNTTTGIIITVVLGILLFVYGLKFKDINKASKKGVFRFLKYAVIAGVCAELALSGFLAIYGSFDSSDFSEEAVIVLGAGVIGDRVSVPLKMRLDKAVEYHRKNPDAVICVTGGKGFQETVTEAYAMEKYLVSCGVDPGVIIKEEEATSTSENMNYSKEILDRQFGDDYRIVVITNGFHIYRGVFMARRTGFQDVSHIHAGVQWYNVIPCYIRESLAVLKMWAEALVY